MFRIPHSLPGRLVGIALIGLLAACAGQGNSTSNGGGSAPQITAGPSPTGFVIPPNTLVPATGPTFDYSQKVGLDILNAVPKQIGRFTLETDPKKTYVATTQAGQVVGVVAVYATAKGSELYVSIWITLSANDAVDRYTYQINQLNQYFNAQTFPVELGDQAVVAPFVKPAKQDIAFINAPVWGLLRFRNIVIDLYPTKNLTDEVPDFSKDEATQLLTAMFNALPK